MRPFEHGCGPCTRAMIVSAGKRYTLVPEETIPSKAKSVKSLTSFAKRSAQLAAGFVCAIALAAGVPTVAGAQVLTTDNVCGKTADARGTHGKTTASSMLTQIMIQCGKDPSAVIGGELPLIHSHGRVGETQNMVCEACEFKDHFLKLDPDIAIILNVDADHLEYFKNIENIIKSFNKFAKMANKAVIYNGDDANTLKAVADVGGKDMITFGLDKSNDFYAENVEMVNAFAHFDAYKKGEKIGSVKLKVPGKHNVTNALAALAAADYCGISFDKAIASLEQFGGACRRFEILAKLNGITFADDYAHHPTELRVTLEAAMQMKYRKVWAVFQPFTYSRTKKLMDDFAEVLKIPDECVMTEIMGSREVNTEGVYTSQLAAKIPGSVWFNTFDEVADYVLAHVQSGDLVITLGCGDIYKAAKIMIKRLEDANM